MRQHLPLLLLLYLTLDFANPLMPGAVRFEAGSIEVVQADRIVRAARPATSLARLIAVFPTGAAAPMDATLARPVPVPPPALSVASRAARRAPPQLRSTPPAPAED